MTETQAKWSERVREWRLSGQSAEEFAQGRGFKGSTLRFWASTLKRPERVASATPSAPPHVRMARVVRTADAGAAIEVAVGAARVVVRAGFDRRLLWQVIEALGGES